MNAAKVKAIPDGMQGFIPHLVCAGAADAIEFYKKAFGAVEETRLPGPGGKLMHAMIRFADKAGDTLYTACARHWSVADREAHEKMGFHEGWGKCTDQLAALVAKG